MTIGVIGTGQPRAPGAATPAPLLQDALFHFLKSKDTLPINSAVSQPLLKA